MAQLEPSDSSLLDTWWMRVDASREIGAPPDQVWRLVGDESSWLSWYRPLARFEPVGEPTSGIGATFLEEEWVWKTTSQVVSREEPVHIGLSTNSINLRGLLRSYFRSIDLSGSPDGSTTLVEITGAFRFGALGWMLLPFTYPQMLASLFVEYRSALKGLAAAVEDAD